MSGNNVSPEDYAWANAAGREFNRVAAELRERNVPEGLVFGFREIFDGYLECEQFPNQVKAAGQPDDPKYWIIKSGSPSHGWHESYSIADESDVIATFFVRFVGGVFSHKSWVKPTPEHNTQDPLVRIRCILSQCQVLGYHVPSVDVEYE